MNRQDDDPTKGGKGRGPNDEFMPALSPNQKRLVALMSGVTTGGRHAANQNGDAGASCCEDDPAFAIGVAMFFWRYCRRGLPMPKRVMALIERHASAGDPACILVRDWLRARMTGTVGAHRRALWVFKGGRKG